MKADLIERAKAHVTEVLKFPPAMVPRLVAALEKTLDDAASALEAIDTGNPDYTEIRRVTHILMGNAPTVGAAYLGDLALLLNAAAHAEKREACAAGIRLVLAEIK